MGTDNSLVKVKGGGAGVQVGKGRKWGTPAIMSTLKFLNKTMYTGKLTFMYSTKYKGLHGHHNKNEVIFLNR